MPACTRIEVLKQYSEGLKENKVLGFFENHRFLSNFHLCQVVWNEIEFPSSEHAYQAAKSPLEYVQKEISILKTPSEAKKIGDKISIHSNWDYMKYDVMYNILKDKFTRNLDIQTFLLDTGEMYLEETNWWKDRYWGVYCGIGDNNLGKVLMSIREEIRNSI
jgi:ribA/ribD-fused uncharacterized protein